jgi:hypothetical protein
MPFKNPADAGYVDNINSNQFVSPDYIFSHYHYPLPAFISSIISLTARSRP